DQAGQTRVQPLERVERETSAEWHEHPQRTASREDRRKTATHGQQHGQREYRQKRSHLASRYTHFGGGMDDLAKPAKQISGFEQRASKYNRNPNVALAGRQAEDQLPLRPKSRERWK